MLATQILGCATIGNKIGEAIVPALVGQTMGIMATSSVFYARESRWPQNIDELRAFVEKNKLGSLDMSEGKIPTIPITHPRFDGTKFTTLPNGDLEVKLANYQEVGELTFTVSKPKMPEKQPEILGPSHKGTP